MSSLLGGSTDGIPTKYTSESSFPNEPAVSLATFRFKKIGQPPALLQRMSASGRNAETSQQVNPDSRSPSPDLEDELLISDSSPDALNNGLPSNNAQPSLRARMALSEPPIEESGSMDVDAPKFIQNQVSSANSLGSVDGSSRRPSQAKKPSPSAILQNGTNATSSRNINERSPDPAELSFSGRSPFSGPSSIRRVQPSTNRTVMHHTNLLEASTFSESPTLKSLRDLQSLLSSDLNSPSTDISDALRLGQTIKDQCVHILSASRNAHELAHQSIASARESLEASLKSLAVAESLQTRVDELITSVTRINSERNEGWKNAIAPFATRLTQLVEDVNDQEKSNAEARRLQELNQRVAEREVHAEVPGQPSNLPMDKFTSRTEAEDALSRIEREATIASEDLIRNREEAEARQRAAEEALRQRREAEDLLEQQRQRAQAELDLLEEKFKQAQTERLEAEEKERLRQEEEIRIMKMKEEEKKMKEDQAAQLAIEERDKRAAVALQKQQALQRDKVAREAALRDRLEKEKMAREQEAEVLQAKEDEKERLRQQELTRQQIRDHNIRASKEAAKEIQAIQAQDIPLQASSSSNHNSQTVPASSSVPVSPGINNSRPETPTTSPEAQSLLASDSLAINFPPQHQAASVSGVIGRSSKNRSSIGLPSPPLEEHKISGGHPSNDRARSAADSASGVQCEHEATVGNQTQQHTVQPKYSKSPSKQQSIFPEVVEPENISVDNNSRGMGKVPLSTHSRASPPSPTARKSSLGKSTIKPDPEESKFVDVKPSPSQLNVKVEPMLDYKPTIKTETPDKKLKFDSPSDSHIPPLSMPSPPARPTMSEISPTSQMPERGNPQPRFPLSKRHILDPIQESSSVSRTSLPLPGRSHDRIVPTKTANQDGQTSDMLPSLTLQGGSRSRVASFSLPTKPPPMEPLPQLHANDSASAGTPVEDFDDHRMGPDAAVPDSTIPPVHPDLIENDSSRPWHRRMAPRVDHYSPSPPPPPNFNSRGVPARPRRGDRYSPRRRSPETRGAYRPSRTSPGPPWNRERDTDNDPSSRGLLPGPPAPNRARHPSRRSPSPESEAQIGRKRNRETQDTVGPPSNRPRHVYTDNAHPQVRGNINAADSRQQYDDDWSRTANYGRSPSPEPRSTPLAFRLEEALHTVRLPTHKLDPKSYADRRRDAVPSYPHAASSSSEIKPNPPYNVQRHNAGDRPDNSRPHLLDRFTDLPIGGSSSIPEPSHQYSTYNKGPRIRKQPYQRPNIPQQHQQPLEQRLNSKTSLISRLQQQ